MSKALFAALMLLLIPALTSAGTVTLVGTCRLLNLTNGMSSFTLSNSGNDTALNLVIAPMVQGATPHNASYTSPSLGPQSSLNFTLTFSNVSHSGTHWLYYTTSYEQGTSFFTAVFPCVVPFSNITVSRVFLAANVSPVRGRNETILVHAFNAGSETVSANFSLALPPTFIYVTNESYRVALPPYSNANITFRVLLPAASLQSSYGAAALVSYSSMNLSYAGLVQFTIAYAGSSASATSQLLIYGAAALVVVVAVLVVLSLRRRRKTTRS